MIKKIWPVFRFCIFIVLGLMNTVFIKPELVGTLENYIGYALLVLALVDIVFFVKTKIQSKKAAD